MIYSDVRQSTTASSREQGPCAAHPGTFNNINNIWVVESQWKISILLHLVKNALDQVRLLSANSQPKGPAVLLQLINSQLLQSPAVNYVNQICICRPRLCLRLALTLGRACRLASTLHNLAVIVGIDCILEVLEHLLHFIAAELLRVGNNARLHSGQFFFFHLLFKRNSLQVFEVSKELRVFKVTAPTHLKMFHDLLCCCYGLLWYFVHSWMRRYRPNVVAERQIHNMHTIRRQDSPAIFIAPLIGSDQGHQARCHV
mmetsp:Transcript_17169/g.36274  ORF Transcript_17169/g.36274 Transcript_17169/m.36274 type:complete len:257 (+) Transcript_17169:115-885(+)